MIIIHFHRRFRGSRRILFHQLYPLLFLFIYFPFFKRYFFLPVLSLFENSDILLRIGLCLAFSIESKTLSTASNYSKENVDCDC